MLLTLTGTRLVDWSAFLVLVIASATASGAGEYKIIYDAGKTGCGRLYIYQIIMPLNLLRKLLGSEIIKRFITCCILCKGAARSRRLPAGKSCTSPLVVTLPSLAAASSKIFAPLTTKPAITPKNGLSTLPLLRFHRPPT